MSKVWESDTKLFLLVLAVAVVSQAATQKKLLARTAEHAMRVGERFVHRTPTKLPTLGHQPSRQAKLSWSGTLAYLESRISRGAKPAAFESRQATKSRPHLRLPWHAPRIRPLVLERKTSPSRFAPLSRSWWKRAPSARPPQDGDHVAVFH